MNKIIPALLILLCMVSCATYRDKTKKNSNEESGDLFYDEYINHVYTNKKCNLQIIFNDQWEMKIRYLHFDKFEREFADSFNSETSEVLFIGYNDTIHAGVRCTVDAVAMKNDLYYGKIKNNNTSRISSFAPIYKIEESVFLKNLEGYHSVINIKVNPNNLFTFDSMYFKSGVYNYRLDFWISQSNYEANKEMFMNIFNSINISSFDGSPQAPPGPQEMPAAPDQQQLPPGPPPAPQTNQGK